MSNIIDSIELSGITYTLSAQTSGGASYTAGRGIDISNDVISFTLPISAGTGTNSIIEGQNTIASGTYSHAEGNSTSATSTSCHAEGYYTRAMGNYAHAEGFRTSADSYSHSEGYNTSAKSTSHAEGNYTIADGYYSHAEGTNTKAKGYYSHAEGNNTSASAFSSHAEGEYTKANNLAEHASGRYNVSSKASDTFGNAGNTLFSVGNGTTDYARHNAFEIRQNGDIYITSGSTDIKLQDHLGGGSGGGGGNPTVELTQAQYDALVTAGTVSADTYYIITDATPIDITQYWTSAETETAIQQAISDATTGKADTTAVTVINNALTAHTADTTIHVTSNDKSAWNAKADLSDIPTVTTAVTINSTDVITSGGVYQQLGGMKIVKLTQDEYDALPSHDSSTIYFIVG